MTNKLKRYDCDLKYIGTGEYVPEMKESPEGDYYDVEEADQVITGLENALKKLDCWYKEKVEVIKELEVKLEHSEQKFKTFYDAEDVNKHLTAELQKANDRIAELESALEQSAKDYCKVNNFTSELKRKAAAFDYIEKISREF